MMFRLLGALMLIGLATSANAQCRQALALGLDVSGSVDAREYRLQMDGLAQALSASTVQSKLLSQTDTPVMLLVYEWSGPNDQHTVLPWQPMTSVQDLEQIIAVLQNTQRRDASPGTALGQAMQVGAAHLSKADCWAKTLDISGDGKSNLGIRPRDAKPLLAPQGITVNGLVIGADAPTISDTRQTEIGELSSYFRAEVILGPDAFVETSLGFADYAAAMTRKLVRELQEVQLSLR
ncbi:MAG: DUF1194 domain-containing protein [Ascidiaceihabitans sp.]|nr:DUF1194 domain-containing protein [Ascidiaceihabitans sp.]